jgi:hypothetical protein
VLALSPEDLVNGSQDALRDRKYALLHAMAFDWPETSPEYASAEEALRSLTLVIVPLTEDA